MVGLRIPWHRAVAVALAALALLAWVPALHAAAGEDGASAAPGGAPALTARGPDAFHVGASLAVEAAGLRVERGVSKDLAAPRTTLVPDARTGARLSDVAGDLPADLALDLGAARREGATTTTALAPMTVASGPASPVASPAIAAALSITAAILAALAWLWPHTKKFAAVALYAHIGRAEALENEVRDRVFSLIKAEPGIHASDVAVKAGVSWGTAMYHLEVLEQVEMVVAHKDGRYRRYFANGAAQGREAASILKNARSAGVAALVRERPGLTQRELSAAVGLTPQALHWHLRRLEKAGLVTKVREGRVVRHFAPEAAGPANA